MTDEVQFWMRDSKKVAYRWHERAENRFTLVFLHDSLGCMHLWRNFPDLVAERLSCNVLVYDRLGYGQSDGFLSKDRGLDYMELEADFLLELMDELSIPQAGLFGHSDGASIAIIAAAKFPERIQSLVIEGAHTLVEEITLAGIRAARTSYENTDLPQKLAKYHGSKVDDLMDAWTNTWLRSDFMSWNIVHFASDINCPVLVFQGEKDEFGSARQIAVFENNPSAIVHHLQGIGHNPHKEDSKLCLSLCEEFYKSSFNN